jgi:hypothetical protein
MARLVIGTDKTATTPAVVIEKGIVPTGTLSITQNGTYDVTQYASADVNTPAAPAHYIEKTVDANGKLVNGSTIIDLTGVTDIGDFVLGSSYRTNISISGMVDMSSLTTVSGTNACNYMFNGCIGITSINLSSLTTISGANSCQGMFGGCSITEIDLSSLTTISGMGGAQNMFGACVGLLNANLSSLTTISGQSGASQMFASCGHLVSVNLNSLTTITGSGACGQMFFACTALTELRFPAITTTSFGSYTNQFNNMCSAIPSITLHFPSNVQSVIEGLTGYSTTAPFGATSGTVLFDLPATE